MNFKKYLALGTALTLTLLAGCGSPGPGGGVFFRLSKNRIASAFGKEDSYERNPSGVSFVFNHRIFRTFIKVLKMLFQLVKKNF